MISKKRVITRVIVVYAMIATAPALAYSGKLATITIKGAVMNTAAPARPGYFAELEELEAARKAGTLAAFDLFLERHPTSRYAPIAREEREKIAAEGK